MTHHFDPDSFEAQVLTRLAVLETEVKNIKRALNGRAWYSGGVGGGVAAGMLLMARLLGWL